MLGNRVWATFTFLVRIQCGQRLASPLVTDGGKKRRLQGERDVVRVFFCVGRLELMTLSIPDTRTV